MMFSSTRTLVRKAAMAASSVSVSTTSSAVVATASTGCRTIAVPARMVAREIHRSSRAMNAGRQFSSLPTDNGTNGGSTDVEAKQEAKTAAPPPVSAVSVDTDTGDDVSPAEVEDITIIIDDTDNMNANELNKNLKPSEIVDALDRHIVGQPDAKKSVAIAMRNRWRRRQLPEDLRKEVTPRNVLLVGPTG